MALSQKLTRRYVAALTLTGILFVINYAVFAFHRSEASGDASLINISGRQRMLSQRIAYLAIEKKIQSDPEKSRTIDADLRAAIAQMEHTHEFLHERSMRSPGGQEAQSGKNDLDRKIRDFLAAFKNSGSFQAKKIDELLHLLDEAVNGYEEEDAKNDKKLEQSQQVVLLLGMIALIFSGLSIFRPMIREIASKTEDLLKSNRRLLAERDRMKLLSEFSAIANESRTFEEAVRRTIAQICDRTGWPIGHAYEIDSENPDRLLSMRLWGLRDEKRFEAFRALTENTSVSKGICLPGRVLETSVPIWIVDVALDRNFPRNAPAACGEIHSAFAFPIQAFGKTVSVLEFFSDDVIPEDSALLSIVAYAGAHLSQVFERAQAEKEIVEFNRTLDERVRDRTRTIVEQQETIVSHSKMSALGEMAGGVAHEINTPLAAITVLSSQMSELLDDETLDRDLLRGHAGKIENTALRIAKIVKGLRSFSRNAGNDPFVEVRAAELIEDVFSLCQERFALHGIAISHHLGEDDIVFKGRPSQLAQVLLNLINNAYDAVSELDEKWVRVEIVRRAETVEIRVTDSGSGIPVHVREKIFNPFFTTKEIGKGTGIGLSISVSILLAHHGELTLNGDCKNTQFVLRMPVDLEAVDEAAA